MIHVLSFYIIIIIIVWWWELQLSIRLLSQYINKYECD